MSEQKMSIIEKLQTSKATEIPAIPEVASRFKHLYSVMHRGDGAVRYESEKFHFMKILNEKSDLQQCSKISLYGCFLDAAVNGLSFDPGAKHLYVVSFSVNVGTKQMPSWEKRATLMVSGIGELMMRMKQGQIRYADNPVLVYEGDHFKYGTDKAGFYVEHEAVIPRASDNIIACYIRLERMDGSNDYKIITMAEIDKIRKFSKDPNSKAWTDGLPGMIQAKCIKHAFRTYPRLQYGDFSKLATQEIEPEDQPENIDYGIGNITTNTQIKEAVQSGQIKDVKVVKHEQVINDNDFAESEPNTIAAIVHDSDEF